MHPSIIVPISLLVVGVVGIGLAIPMLLNKVPRNDLYGFRTKRTLSSDEIWYPANRFAAKALICWGMLTVSVAIPAFWFLPLSNKAQLLLVIPGISVVVPCVISILWVNKKYAGQSDSHKT